MLEDQDSAGYEVGYKKPPKHRWFQPGQSGNPSGKRKEKKRPSFANTLDDLYAETTQVIIDGKPTTVTAKEWLVERQGLRAAKGSVSALNSLLDLYDTEDPRELESEIFEVTEEEAKALGPP
jgi:Family of unknown function (DUF5681)